MYSMVMFSHLARTSFAFSATFLVVLLDVDLVDLLRSTPSVIDRYTGIESFQSMSD